jgi:hypothetical protein
VSGIDGTSRNNKRPAGVADSFQVRKHVVEFHSDDASNVLAKNPSGSRFANNAQHFRPERAVICRASSLPGNAERLARKSTCDEVAAFKVSSVKGEYVWFDVCLGAESFFNDALAVFVDFAEGDGLESCFLRRAGESADLMPEKRSRCVGFSGMPATPP